MRWYFRRKMNKMAGNLFQQGNMEDLDLEQEMGFDQEEEETGAEVIDLKSKTLTASLNSSFTVLASLLKVKQ